MITSVSTPERMKSAWNCTQGVLGTHIRKVIFLVVGPLRFCPPPTLMAQWSMPLFFVIQSQNSLKQILKFPPPPIFGLIFLYSQKKKCFLLSGQGVYPHPLSGLTTKNTLFYGCFLLKGGGSHYDKLRALKTGEGGHFALNTVQFS